MDTKQLAQRWFDEVWNNKNPAYIAELMDASAIGLMESGEITGPEEFKALVFEPLVAAFPDVKVTVDRMIAEKDDVAVKWTVSATHGGPLMHFAATGERVKFSGSTWLTFKNGKIIAGSDSYNLHGLFAFLSSGAECASVRRA